MIPLLRRLAVIGGKAGKLCWLLMLIRCLGPENVAAHLGCATVLRERARAALLTLHEYVRHVVVLIWLFLLQRYKND